MHNDPSIPDSIANTTGANLARSWPTFSADAPFQVNLNETGGTPYLAEVTLNTPSKTQYWGEGLENDFRLVNAYTWEGGRGRRCDFWRSVAAAIPG